MHIIIGMNIGTINIEGPLKGLFMYRAVRHCNKILDDSQ